MLREAEDGRTLGLPVTANSFKDAGAVVNYMAHDVNVGLLPGNEIAVVPYFGGGLDRHGVGMLLEILGTYR
jgi:hypothetical protein